MDTEVKTCSREGCGNRLKASNKKGICGYCQGGCAPGYKPAKPKAIPKPPGAGHFELVTKLLGLDPAAVVEALKTEWLANLKDHVRIDP